MGAAGALTRAELGLGFEIVDLLDAILDKERLRETLQLEPAHAAVEFGEHGFEDRNFFGVGASGLGECGLGYTGECQKRCY
jgi:hypothetical protein